MQDVETHLENFLLPSSMPSSLTSTSPNFLMGMCRYESDMLAFSGCYYGGGEKENRELGAIRKRWKTLHVSTVANFCGEHYVDIFKSSSLEGSLAAKVMIFVLHVFSRPPKIGWNRQSTSLRPVYIQANGSNVPRNSSDLCKLSNGT